KGSVFAPFFSVPQAARANGTGGGGGWAGAKMLGGCMGRKLDRRGYSLHISEVMNDYPGEDKQIAAGYINKVIEREILRAPEQYLWVHRRFKTRPLGEPSVY
ncbi:kdo(2)-lipid IV(A) palmitoleoyltransferase, partial [Acinetobacter baumannii]|nr:kdo(2)-lipid IV(A) palmitoleoyltransferase [Acinetobacter baumannii]